MLVVNANNPEVQWCSAALLEMFQYTQWLLHSQSGARCKRNTSCLPMDVAHREGFFLFDDREGFAFGFEGNFTKPAS